MKKLYILLAFIVLASCKKDTIIQLGLSYHIKGNIFNKGAFQPTQPVKVDSLYIDSNSGKPFAKVTDSGNPSIIWYIPQKDLK